MVPVNPLIFGEGLSFSITQQHLPFSGIKEKKWHGPHSLAADKGKPDCHQDERVSFPLQTWSWASLFLRNTSDAGLLSERSRMWLLNYFQSTLHPKKKNIQSTKCWKNKEMWLYCVSSHNKNWSVVLTESRSRVWFPGKICSDQMFKLNA